MKSGISLPAGIIIFAIIAIAPATAISIDEIDTGSLDIPEIDPLNFSKTPIGSAGALLTYAEHLIDAVNELLDFIDSIFEMLGMGESPDVGNLMKTLKEEVEGIGI
jgi:hypothetical protein